MNTAAAAVAPRDEPVHAPQVIAHRYGTGPLQPLPGPSAPVRRLAAMAALLCIVLALLFCLAPLPMIESAPGVVMSYAGHADVATPIPGRLRLLVGDQQHVRQGQVLATISAAGNTAPGAMPATIQSLQHSATQLARKRDAEQAQYAARLDRLGQLQTVDREQLGALAEAIRIQSERSRAADLRARTIEPLAAQRYVTQSEYLHARDQAHALALDLIDRRKGEAAVHARIAQRSFEMREVERERAVRQADAEAQINRLQGDIVTAQDARQQHIIAPRDGIVTAVSASDGDHLQAGIRILSVGGGLHGGDVIAYVPASIRSQLHAGGMAMIELRLGGGQQQSMDARILDIGSAELRQTASQWSPADLGGVFRVRLSPRRNGDAARFWPGQSVNARFILANRTLLQRIIGRAP